MGAAADYRIERSVGNNVVLTVRSDTGQEYVLFGKGLGFDAKGQEVLSGEDSRIEKRYRLDDKAEADRYRLLLEEIEPESVAIAERIVERIRRDMGIPVSPKVYFALPSHIQFAVYRLHSGMEISNPFLEETKLAFPQEYAIAAEAALMIEEAFGVPIPEEEIGFLAFHVHSAAGELSAGQLARRSKLVGETIALIEREGGISIPRSGSDYARLVMHLHHAVDRLSEGKSSTNPFADEIAEKFPDVHRIAALAAVKMKEELDLPVSKNEIAFLAMHVHRLLEAWGGKGTKAEQLEAPGDGKRQA
ncbi:PRD domain-containing protein [Paenibacillus pasadenensis]|uniref:PRD domain-containing protein n=1 Tax=Paenibacillus pasadenensis TaxID=217090 RepID=UPI0020405AF2|nr:PRD domain-containing protein [Paenibacillus pasadenensis]MCM3747675.1 PRD domain-containing protein [Paenibacillus pasadenensis]